MSEDNSVKSFEPNFSIPLVSGAMAGMCVDFTLFPIDTIKTRIQSDVGFWKSGGFKRIYSGLTSTMIGSAPNAAIFFCTYETSKTLLKPFVSEKYEPIIHMMSASFGEVMACLVRVPVEVVKQRAQTTNVSSISVFRRTVTREGFKGLYRGYLSTIVREIPFSLIQFPIWEFAKKTWSNHQRMPIEPWQSMICGAFAGGIAAFLTTPLDLAKTRIMLAEQGTTVSSGNILVVLKLVYSQKGLFGLFSGAVPRVIWISVGGAIFLGSYEKVSSILRNL